MDGQPEPTTPSVEDTASAVKERLLAEWKDSVLKIKTETGSGSGFFVDDQTIATNYHVVKGSRTFKAQDSSGQWYTLGAQVYADPEHDLALLTIHGRKPTTVKPIPIASGDADYCGESLYHLGHPKAQELKLLEGRGKGRCDELKFYQNTQAQVSNSRRLALQAMIDNPQNASFLCQPLLVVEAPGVTHGSSGAPFLDRNGYVAAIVRKGVRNQDDTVYCAPSKYLQDLIKRSQQGSGQNLPEHEFFARSGKYETGMEHYFGQLRANPKGFVQDSVPLAIATAGAILSRNTPLNEAISQKTGLRINLGLSLAGLSLVPLAINDLNAYNDSTDRLTRTKYELALASDATMGNGFTLKTMANGMQARPFSIKMGRAGVALGLAGMVGRLGAEFIPNCFSVDIPYFDKSRY